MAPPHLNRVTCDPAARAPCRAGAVLAGSLFFSLACGGLLSSDQSGLDSATPPPPNPDTVEQPVPPPQPADANPNDPPPLTPGQIPRVPRSFVFLQHEGSNGCSFRLADVRFPKLAKKMADLNMPCPAPYTIDVNDARDRVVLQADIDIGFEIDMLGQTGKRLAKFPVDLWMQGLTYDDKDRVIALAIRPTEMILHEETHEAWLEVKKVLPKRKPGLIPISPDPDEIEDTKRYAIDYSHVQDSEPQLSQAWRLQDGEWILITSKVVYPPPGISRPATFDLVYPGRRSIPYRPDLEDELNGEAGAVSEYQVPYKLNQMIAAGTPGEWYRSDGDPQITYWSDDGIPTTPVLIQRRIAKGRPAEWVPMPGLEAGKGYVSFQQAGPYLMSCLEHQASVFHTRDFVQTWTYDGPCASWWWPGPRRYPPDVAQ